MICFYSFFIYAIDSCYFQACACGGTMDGVQMCSDEL